MVLSSQTNQFLSHVQLHKTSFLKNEQDRMHDYITCLHLACYKGDLPFVKLLAPLYKHHQPLYELLEEDILYVAAERGHFDILNFLMIEFNYTVNKTSLRRRRRTGTLLHGACTVAQEEVAVNLICKMGASTLQVNHFKLNAMGIALVLSHEKLVKALMMRCGLYDLLAMNCEVLAQVHMPQALAFAKKVKQIQENFKIATKFNNVLVVTMDTTW